MTKRNRQSELIHLIILDIQHLSSVFRKDGEHHARAVGLTQPQWTVLAQLALSDRKTVPQLARRAGLTRQTVQRTVDQLVEARCVSLVANPDHLRSPHVLISEKGRTNVARLEKLMTERRLGFISTMHVSRADLEAAERVLRAMREFKTVESDR